ncbi:small ribosomal subunit protein mS38 [Hyperolius riggenbachi]|uniref:small ribosomal subunit protein mS38 n=1 Tax=Hyperolius riggenbachi TaxID=752182 RepID=UPI0035A395B1
MWLTRLTSRLCTATRLAGVTRPWSLSTSQRSFFACYSTRQPQKQPTTPPVWYSLQAQLDELLVPRMMSITPLESLLTSRYSLPKHDAFKTQQEPEDHLEVYDCPTFQDSDLTGEGSEQREVVQCKSLIKIRRRKINGHQYRKLQNRMKFLRRKVLHKRCVRKQKKFERDLTRIWRKAGLKKAPTGWTMPNIFLKNRGPE